MNVSIESTNSFFFFGRTLKNFNTHIGREVNVFKETYSGVYPKWPNSWIHSTNIWVTKLLVENNILVIQQTFLSIFERGIYDLNNFLPTNKLLREKMKKKKKKKKMVMVMEVIIIIIIIISFMITVETGRSQVNLTTIRFDKAKKCPTNILFLNLT